jgi:hypothetical protein
MGRIVLYIILGFGVAMCFTRFDAYPNIGTYGVSYGTDSHYCSFELVYGDPMVSCESAK